jgi:hypothetical protein
VGITTTYADATDPKNVESALQANTRLVFLETPSNPLLSLCDIASIAEIVHRRKDILFAVDNTFLTPYYQVTSVWRQEKSRSYSFTPVWCGNNTLIAYVISYLVLSPLTKFGQNRLFLNLLFSDPFLLPNLFFICFFFSFFLPFFLSFFLLSQGYLRLSASRFRQKK